MSTTTSRGYSKAVDADNANTYIKTTLGATIDLVDADMTTALGQGRNLLTNPGFEIWQRGNGAFTASGAYAADRWVIAIGTSTVSVSRESTNVDAGSLYSAAVTYTHVGAGTMTLSQVIEDFAQLRGKTITLAVRVKSSVIGTVHLRVNDGATNTDGTANLTTGWETLSLTVAIPSNAVSVTVRVRFSVATCVCYLDNATLVVGAVAAAYTPLHAHEDISRCLRYYEVHGGTTGLQPMGYGGAGLVSAQAMLFAARKVGTPTITKNGTWTVTNCAQPSADMGHVAGYRLYTTVTALGQYLYYPDSADDTITAEAN